MLYDTMAVLQSMTPLGPTFSGLSQQIFTTLMQGCCEGGRVDFVIDLYPQISIQNWEGSHRSSSVPAGIVIKIRQGDQKIPMAGRSFSQYLPTRPLFLSSCSGTGNVMNMLLNFQAIDSSFTMEANAQGFVQKVEYL